MARILPEGDALRKAVAYLQNVETINFQTIQDASLRFDLSPKDETFLIRQFLQKKKA